MLDARCFETKHLATSIQHLASSPDGSVMSIEHRWRHSRSRRRALASLAGLVAGTPLGAGAAQQHPRPLKNHRPPPGLDEMFSSFDFEPVMFANLPMSIYDYTAH